MYAITVQTHHYTGTYGADDRELLLECWPEQDPETFATRKGAVEYARNVSSTNRELRHGEYATPTYRVVKVGSKRYERLYRRTFGD